MLLLYRSKLFALPLLLAAAFVPSVALRSSPPDVVGLKDVLVLGKEISVLKDETGSLDVGGAMASSDWQPSTKDYPAFGFTSAAYWVRIPLRNSGRETDRLFLEIGYPLIDSLQLFEDGSNPPRLAGDHLPFSQREMAHRNFVFRLDLTPGSSVRYLRFKTTSSMNISLRLWRPSAFLETSYTEQLVLGIYYGVILIMVLYNLSLYVFVRDASYLYYVLSIGGYAMYQLTLNGHSYQFLWPNLVWWGNVSLTFFLFFGACAAKVFTRSLLQTRKNAPILDRFLLVLIWITGPGAIVSLFVPYRFSIIAGALLVLVSVIGMYVAGVRTVLRGYPPARYYLIAWSMLLFGVGVYVLKTFAILPDNFITTWSQQMGSAVEVLLLSLALGARISLLREQNEKAQAEMLAVQKALSDSFARFVPREFLSFLSRASISDVQLGDQTERSMTILFADIRSFSRLSEKMTPEENFNFLNSYLKRVGPIVRGHNGFIDKFIGDAIMALFPGPAEDAVKAAAELQRVLRVYNHHRIRRGFDPIRVGIGIHTGNCMLGTIGESERMETTVISDTVNLASRVSDLTKRSGSAILISESTLFGMTSPSDYAFRMIGRVRVKGKTKPVSVFEVFNGQADYALDLMQATRRAFEEGVASYYAGQYDEALTAFEEVLRHNPADMGAQLYASAIRRERR